MTVNEIYQSGLKLLENSNIENLMYDEKRYALIRHLEIVKSKIRKKYALLPRFYHRKVEEELQLPVENLFHNQNFYMKF